MCVANSKVIHKANEHTELHHNCKKGQNGLTVASADVIVCKNTKKLTHHHSRHAADYSLKADANDTSSPNQPNHC